MFSWSQPNQGNVLLPNNIENVHRNQISQLIEIIAGMQSQPEMGQILQYIKSQQVEIDKELD